MKLYIKEIPRPDWAYEMKRECEKSNPYCLIAWKFSARQYIENRKYQYVEEIHLTKEKWKEILYYDKAEIAFKANFCIEFTTLPLGDITYEDCYLDVVEKGYTYEEYLELEKEEK